MVNTLLIVVSTELKAVSWSLILTKHVKCEGSFFQSVPVYIFFIVAGCKYPKSFCLIECASGVVYYSSSFATKVWVKQAYRAQKTGIFLELLNWYNFRKDCRVAMCCRLRNKMSMKWSPTVSTNIQRLDFSRRNRK